MQILCRFKLLLASEIIYSIKSGTTPQVASLAVHMSVRASKLPDVNDKCMIV